MAYLFKLLKLDKATHGKLKQRKQNPSSHFQTKCIAQNGHTKYKAQVGKILILELPNCLGSSKLLLIPNSQFPSLVK